MSKKRMLHVTPALKAAYAGQNCWNVITADFRTGIPCGQLGFNHGRCTLPMGHGGLTHVAHNYALNHSGGVDMDQIHEAWADDDPDLETDEGL